MQKQTLIFSNNFQILVGGILIQKEQLSFWEEVQIPNRI
jgi:hypothetical protein